MSINQDSLEYKRRAEIFRGYVEVLKDRGVIAHKIAESSGMTVAKFNGVMRFSKQKGAYDSDRVDQKHIDALEKAWAGIIGRSLDEEISRREKDIAYNEEMIENQEQIMRALKELDVDIIRNDQESSLWESG